MRGASVVVIFFGHTHKDTPMALATTHQRDIDLHCSLQSAYLLHTAAKHVLSAHIATAIAADIGEIPATESVVSTGRAHRALAEKFARLPHERKQWIDMAARFVNAWATRVDGLLPNLSGTSTVRGQLGAATKVTCATSRGDKYPGGNNYYRTDGRLQVTLNAESILGLQSHAAIADLSERDGLVLLSINATDHARVYTVTWVRPSRGYSLVTESGWIAVQGSTVYHSRASIQHAEAGLLRKLRSSPQSGSLSHCEVITRRALHAVTGWCGPGVQAWIAQRLPDYRRAKQVPREIVLEAAKADRSHYGRRLVQLLTAQN